MVAFVSSEQHERVAGPLVAVAARGPVTAAAWEILVDGDMIGGLTWGAEAIVGDIALLRVAIKEAEIALHRIVNEPIHALPAFAVLGAIAVVAISPGGLALDSAP